MTYALGRGVIKDYTQAHMWVNIASTNGHATAMKIRDRLGKLMTPTQIAEAQRLAREWVESQ